MAIGANFGITGKGQFVYYQDDYVNHHPEVGNSILKDVSNIQTNKENNIRNAGLSLMAAGMAEATKEKELINQFFGGNLTQINLDSPNFVTELTEAFNFAMQLKSTYERNKYRIQKGLGRVSIYTNFGDYLARAVNENMNLLLGKITNNENIDSACKNYLHDCFDIALKKMLVNSTRGAKSGQADPKFDQTKGDYKAIYDALTNTVTGANHRNYLINELTRVLQLDKLTNYLKQIMLGSELTPTTAEEFKKHFNVTPSSGGLAAENFEGVVQRMIQEGVLPIGELNNLRASFNAGLLKGEVFVTGDYGSKEKADLV